jgi:NAD(P)-dependent dehydrogenase (short-subunit alcohol dehydrogenase family)
MRNPDKRDRLEQALCVTRTLTKTGGKLDALVNNAGVATGGAFEDLPDSELRRVMETDFFGVLRLTRAVLPTFRSQRRGRIVVVSSNSALLGSRPRFIALRNGRLRAGRSRLPSKSRNSASMFLSSSRVHLASTRRAVLTGAGLTIFLRLRRPTLPRAPATRGMWLRRSPMCWNRAGRHSALRSERLPT